jgi:AMMECR1 domain-containing protein
MTYECFYDWIREMRKTKADLRYWTDDEEKVAEYTWAAAWEDSKEFHQEEINQLKARVSLLEQEVAWAENGYNKKIKEEKPTWGNF